MSVHIPCVPPYRIPAERPGSVISSPEEIREGYSGYLSDESRMPGGHADALVFACSENEVIRHMQAAQEAGFPVTVSAARTGIVGGAVPFGGWVLSLERMNRILGVRWEEIPGRWCIRLEPGVSLEALDHALTQGMPDGPSDEDPASREQVLRFRSESAQWWYPVDPTEQTAHLGGTIATNASGARSFAYGQTRSHVTALRVILMDGSCFSISRGRYIDTTGEGFTVHGLSGDTRISPLYSAPQSVKNAAGYAMNLPMDFIDVFIGSEGTLGIITEAEIALCRRPEWMLSGIAFFEDEKQAVQFVKMARTLRQSGSRTVSPAVLEYFDSHSLDLLRAEQSEEGSQSPIHSFPAKARSAIFFEQMGKESEFEAYYAAYDALLIRCGTSMDETWGGLEPREHAQMMLFRHALPERVNALIGARQKEFPHLHKVGTDFAVPDPALDEMMDYYRTRLSDEGFEHVIFGHIGENHVHVNILPHDELELEKAKKLVLEFAQKAVSLGGTISGEHGIGKLKKTFLPVMFSQETIDGMRGVKRALDPKGLLNPGNIFE